VDGNPKLSVFVGNLDFGCKEEDLRVFLEGVVSSERGPPGEDASEDGGKRLKTWVTRVRIVRDKETQLGKGFGYVQFADRECVDEILAMEDTKLKFAKRKLRVQRCKTLPGNSSSSGVRSASATDAKSPVSKSRAPAIPIPIPSIPKGDPSLGGKLAHLPKDERKQIKLSDADRVARRLAKKKARNALAKEGVKTQVKDRDRVRKSIAVKKGSVPRRKESKGRVRSDKSLAKRNAKK
jgi:nucleolar protein 12